MKPIIKIKFTQSGSSCAVDSVREAVEFIALELNENFPQLPKDLPEYIISFDTMTDEEFDNLPDFDGF